MVITELLFLMPLMPRARVFPLYVLLFITLGTSVQAVPSAIGPKAPETQEVEPVSETMLDTVSRRALQEDLTNEWFLLEVSDGEYNCPKTITHTTYKRLGDDQPFMLGHNTIKHEGIRCESNGLEKRLEFFYSAQYDEEFQPVDDVVAPLPEDLLHKINNTGVNVNIAIALRNANEKFFLGYEFIQRVCNGSSVFRDGTVAYIVRPSNSTIRILNLETDLYVGGVYLLMVPRFKSMTCVYATEKEPVPSAEPSGEETEISQTDESTGETEAPGNPPSSSTADKPLPDSTVDSTEASPTPEEDDGVCFPANASVTLSGGAIVRMRDLKVGAHIAIGNGRFSRVFGFSHDELSVRSLFVSATTQSGHLLRATGGHFVYVNGAVKPMREIIVGDRLLLENGNSSAVVHVHTSVLTGLYNAQTEHGDIIVDGVKATTYTTAVLPEFAHAALAPVRAFSRLVDVDALAYVLDGCGMRRWLSFVPKVSRVSNA